MFSFDLEVIFLLVTVLYSCTSISLIIMFNLNGRLVLVNHLENALELDSLVLGTNSPL